MLPAKSVTTPPAVSKTCPRASPPISTPRFILVAAPYAPCPITANADEAAPAVCEPNSNNRCSTFLLFSCFFSSISIAAIAKASAVSSSIEP